nr:nitrilase family protein [Saprospiraceae bacterium]
MDNLLTLTALQWDLAWCNPSLNRERGESLMEMHRHSNAFFLPEMFTTGFTMNPVNNSETMDGPTVDWMRSQASKRNAWVCGSIIVQEEEAYYNRFLCFGPQGEGVHYDKRHLFSYAGENERFQAGNKIVSIEIKGWKIKLMVCYDLRFPVWSRNNDDSDVMVYVANWPSVRRDAWNALLKARAIENLSFVVGVNRVGRDANNIDYQGETQIIDYEGKLLAFLDQNEGLATVTFSKDDLLTFRKRYPFLEDRDQFFIKNI